MLFLEPEVRCSHWCCLEYVDGCFHVNMDANSYTQGCHRMPTTVRPRCGSRTTCPFHVSCDAAAAGLWPHFGLSKLGKPQSGKGESDEGIVFNEKRMKFDVFGGFEWFELKTWSLILIWFWCSWFTEAWRAGASSAMPDDFPDLTTCHVRLENPNCLSSDPRRMWPFCARNTRAFHLIPFLQILILTLSLLIKYVKPLPVEKF